MVDAISVSCCLSLVLRVLLFVLLVGWYFVVVLTCLRLLRFVCDLHICFVLRFVYCLFGCFGYCFLGSIMMWEYLLLTLVG